MAATYRTPRVWIVSATLAMTIVLFVIIMTQGCMTKEGLPGERETIITTTTEVGKTGTIPHENTLSRPVTVKSGQDTRTDEKGVPVDLSNRTRVYDFMSGDTLQFEGRTILSPGNRLLVEVEQPGFGPTAKNSRYTPTGASVTTTVVPGGDGEKNRWSVDIRTRGWNCGEYTVTVTGIDVPVRDQYPFTLLCC